MDSVKIQTSSQVNLSFLTGLAFWTVAVFQTFGPKIRDPERNGNRNSNRQKAVTFELHDRNWNGKYMTGTEM